MATFCGVLTLQVGVTVLAAVFLTLGAAILVANTIESIVEDSGKQLMQVEEDFSEELEEDTETDWPFFIVLAFASLLFIVGGLAFCSAYSESRTLGVAALLALILLTAFWVILCVLNFLGKPATVDTVRHRQQGPESLWLAELDFRSKDGGKRRRREVKETFQDLENEPFRPSDPSLATRQLLDELSKLKSCFKTRGKQCKRDIKEQNCYYHFDILLNTINTGQSKERSDKPVKEIFKKDTKESEKTKRNVQNDSEEVNNSSLPYEEYKGKEKKKEKVKEKDKKGSKFKHGMPFIAAVGLLIANLLFFLFSIFTLWGWIQELSYYDIEEVYYYY